MLYFQLSPRSVEILVEVHGRTLHFHAHPLEPIEVIPARKCREAEDYKSEYRFLRDPIRILTTTTRTAATTLQPFQPRTTRVHENIDDLIEHFEIFG